ncbi:MAG: hypothetical protein FWB88_12020 [Defluviitaleaceae bacterium]|nr:hypothetical protein [Defluviitaleaceae bacterium]
MKIEMGESLFYSWLRHVKECQIVQSNWKPSPSWQLLQEDKLDDFMRVSSDHFNRQYGLDIYKKTSSLSQLLRQAEVDALGISLSDFDTRIYAIDVAYHEGGLIFGNRQKTIARIAKKLLRTAMCLRGYFEIGEGEIIFASPKIQPSTMRDVEPIMSEINSLLAEHNFGFTARLIANDDFNEKIMKPIMTASAGVSDTSELFMRAYQLIKMFGNESSSRTVAREVIDKSNVVHNLTLSDDEAATVASLSELKVGKIAQTVLRDILESGKLSRDELALMRTEDYAKQTFNLNYPLLNAVCKEHAGLKRYYVNPVNIAGETLYMCSQWNLNTKRFLLEWLSDKL